MYYLIFVKFHIPGVIKIRENWSIWILWNFIYPGSWKSEKIEEFDFCEVSCTWGHESWRKLKHLIFVRFRVPGVMKIRENWSIWFLWSFAYAGSWKLEKIEEFGFLWSFVYMGTQNSQKLNDSIFSKIEWPRVHETSLQYHLLTLGSLSISYSGGKGPYLGGLSHLLYNIDPKVRIFSTFIKRPKAAHCPRALYMWKKNGRQSNPRILVMHRSHRKKNWVDRWWFRLPSNRPKLVTIQWVIR